MMSSKHPEFETLRTNLETEKAALVKKSEPLRKQREALLTKLHPLEDQLRKLDKEIQAVERPRLPEIEMQLGKLAVMTGGRSISQNGGTGTGEVEVKGKALAGAAE